MEDIARWLAVIAGLTLVVVLSTLLAMEFARVVDVFPPRLARRGLRAARDAMFLLPLATTVFLASTLAARQAAARTWRSGVGFGLIVVGGTLLVLGLANLVAPAAMFPSHHTCVIDYDVVACQATPWIGARFAAFIGAGLILIGADRNRAARMQDV